MTFPDVSMSFPARDFRLKNTAGAPIFMSGACHGTEARVKGLEMVFIKWDKKYSLGIDEIDSHYGGQQLHERLAPESYIYFRPAISRVF